MKIAIVVPSIHDGGGVTAVALFLYDILSGFDCQIISVSTSKRDRYSVRLLAPKSWLKGIKVERSLWEGKHIVNVGAFMTEIEPQRYMPRQALTQLLNQYDAVQIVAGAPAWAYLAKDVHVPVFLQVATLVKEERRKLIATSTGIRKLYLQLSTAVVGIIEQRALRHVHTVFVENHWMHEYLVKLLGKEKVVMAPPGVDTTLFKPKEHDVAVSNCAHKYIISVGRFSDRRKNVRLLFESYSQLRKMQDCPPLLVLAGLSEPADEDWLFAESLDIRQYVQFKKDVSNAELVALLQHAELFVCSSDEEGLGIAMLEAMACGIPVVSTRCGGPETFISDGVNGYLTDNHDVMQLANRINGLLTNEGVRKNMCAAARLYVETKLSCAAAGQSFIGKYTEVFHSSPRSINK